MQAEKDAQMKALQTQLEVSKANLDQAHEQLKRNIEQQALTMMSAKEH